MWEPNALGQSSRLCSAWKLRAQSFLMDISGFYIGLSLSINTLVIIYKIHL